MGAITFTASAANTTGVVTELLLQPLASANRRPARNAYKHARFATFTAADLEATLTVPAGYYAAAYRFVLTA